VVDRVNDAGALGRREHLARLAAVARHRLLADDVLAGREGGERVFAVQRRRRRHAYDVDVVALDEFPHRFDRDRNTGLVGHGASTFRVRRADRRDLVTRGAEAGDLHACPEPGPHDPHPQRHCGTV